MRDAALDRWFGRFRERGDPKALAKVFDAAAPELLRVAAHLVRDPVEAEDVLQATFLAAIEGAQRWDPERRLMPWLVGILARQAGLVRRREARRPDPAALPTRSIDDPLATAERRELSEALDRAIDALPGKYRDVVGPHLREGPPGAVLAERLGIAPGTVRVRLHRGLRKLRKRLPPAFAVGVILPVGFPRGLAAVRTEVLRTAAAIVPAAAPAAVAGTATFALVTGG